MSYKYWDIADFNDISLTSSSSVLTLSASSKISSLIIALALELTAVKLLSIANVFFDSNTNRLGARRDSPLSL